MDALLISQGLDLLLYGMGTVFTFLTLLVGITSAMSALVNRIAPDQAEVTASAAVAGCHGRTATKQNYSGGDRPASRPKVAVVRYSKLLFALH